MRRAMLMLCITTLITTTLIAGFTSGGAAQPKATNKITEKQIESFINSRSGEYECSSLDKIQIEHLEYFDFIGNGSQEAIVVASTCMTGTAGPDIHAVYARNPEGELVELPFLAARSDPPPGEQTPVFGNPNYGLTVEKGELVATWTDASEREDPVIARYRWDGKRFVLDHMDVKGPYPTSYDCAKATKEVDRAICYSPKIAALDLRLGQAYRRRLQQIPPDQRQELQKQQKAWLTEREKQCVLYKWWVDCLTDMYTKRMVELKQTTENKP